MEKLIIKERDLEVLLDRCKISLRIVGFDLLGTSYSTKQFMESLNRILAVLGEQDIVIQERR